MRNRDLTCSPFLAMQPTNQNHEKYSKCHHGYILYGFTPGSLKWAMWEERLALWKNDQKYIASAQAKKIEGLSTGCHR